MSRTSFVIYLTLIYWSNDRDILTFKKNLRINNILIFDYDYFFSLIDVESFLIHTRFNSLTSLYQIYIFAWKLTFREKSLVALYIYLFNLLCTKISFKRGDVLLYKSKSFVYFCIDWFHNENRCNVQRINQFSFNESSKSLSFQRLEPFL